MIGLKLLITEKIFLWLSISYFNFPDYEIQMIFYL